MDDPFGVVEVFVQGEEDDAGWGVRVGQLEAPESGWGIGQGFSAGWLSVSIVGLEVKIVPK